MKKSLFSWLKCRCRNVFSGDRKQRKIRFTIMERAFVYLFLWILWWHGRTCVNCLCSLFTYVFVCRFVYRLTTNVIFKFCLLLAWLPLLLFNSCVNKVVFPKQTPTYGTTSKQCTRPNMIHLRYTNIWLFFSMYLDISKEFQRGKHTYT